jgi:hypothetical protein
MIRGNFNLHLLLSFKCFTQASKKQRHVFFQEFNSKITLKKFRFEITQLIWSLNTPKYESSIFVFL